MLSIDLYEFIKLNGFKGISIGLIRRFAVQLLQALKFIREQRVVHCDLKPENILLRKANRSGLKVIDFGSACRDGEQVYSYIQSRFYRAPEVVLGVPYSYPIDMWSFGCILAELFTGVPLFTGENEADMLSCFIEVLGPPPREMLERGSRTSKFFDADRNLLAYGSVKGRVKHPSSRPLAVKLGCSDTSFISFLDRKVHSDCLQWTPEARCTPEAAMQLLWITEGASTVTRTDLA